MPNVCKAATAKSALEPYFKETDKVAILIDGYATGLSAQAINLKIDWKRLGSLFRYLSRVSFMNFYLSAAPGKEDETKPLIDWLSHNGYKVTVKPGTVYTETGIPGIDAKKAYKTGYDVDLASDALLLAERVDKVILFSSNIDFCPLVEALQVRGVPTTLITNSVGYTKQMREEGKIKTTGTIGVQLIRAANEFFELDELRSEIEATPSGRDA